MKSFLADDGMVGIAPPSVMVGDQLLRFSDGMTIRRLDSSGTWTVVAITQLNGHWVKVLVS
jgi:hypothetical protein